MVQRRTPQLHSRNGRPKVFMPYFSGTRRLSTSPLQTATTMEVPTEEGSARSRQHYFSAQARQAKTDSVGSPAVCLVCRARAFTFDELCGCCPDMTATRTGRKQSHFAKTHSWGIFLGTLQTHEISTTFANTNNLRAVVISATMVFFRCRRELRESEGRIQTVFGHRTPVRCHFVDAWRVETAFRGMAPTIRNDGELGSSMNFRLEILNTGCVVSTSPLHHYVGIAFSFVGLIACVMVYYVLHSLALRCRSLRRIQQGQRTSSLFGALGTEFMTVFISVSSSCTSSPSCSSVFVPVCTGLF